MARWLSGRRVAGIVIAVVMLGAQLPAQERPSETSSGGTTADWGITTDTASDCQIERTGGRMTITVPGTPHNLNKEISDLNAPRVLYEIEGDFAAEVRVSGDFAPSPVSTVAPKGDPFNGAGLLLWVSEDLFVRLERNIWIEPSGEKVCMPPLFEFMRNGRITGSGGKVTDASFFNTPATWFRLERRDNVITGYLCHGNDVWTSCGQLNIPSLPEKVKIGVAAVNTSNKPFTAVFEGFQIYQ